MRPHSSSQNEQDSPQKNSNLLPPSDDGSVQQQAAPAQKISKLQKPSFITILDGPLNTYQDFKNVFNAKNVGSKTNRRHAPSSNQSRSINQDEIRQSKDSNVQSGRSEQRQGARSTDYEGEMERMRVE